MVAIENVDAAINQIAQTTLRAVVGRHTLDETLSETDRINQNIREILDVQTEEWGVKVTVVELKDIQLPESMKRAMARQAEAEREKRAKIIAAEGEALAAGELGHASDVMMAHPLALQLRNLQTPGRDRRRQELHRHVPRAADEHHRRARRLPGPRDEGGGLGARSARRRDGHGDRGCGSGGRSVGRERKARGRLNGRTEPRTDARQLLGRAWPVVRVGRVSGADAR